MQATSSSSACFSAPAAQRPKDLRGCLKKLESRDASYLGTPFHCSSISSTAGDRGLTFYPKPLPRPYQNTCATICIRCSQPRFSLLRFLSFLPPGIRPGFSGQIYFIALPICFLSFREKLHKIPASLPTARPDAHLIRFFHRSKNLRFILAKHTLVPAKRTLVSAKHAMTSRSRAFVPAAHTFYFLLSIIYSLPFPGEDLNCI